MEKILENDKIGGYNILTKIEGMEELQVLKRRINTTHQNLQNEIVRFTDLCELEDELRKELKNQEIMLDDIEISYKILVKEFTDLLNGKTTIIEEKRNDVQLISNNYQLYKLIYFKLKYEIRDRMDYDAEDCKKFMGLKSSVHQLWECGHCLIAQVRLNTDYRDPDLIKSIYILCEYHHTIDHIINVACYFWKLPKEKYVLQNSNGITHFSLVKIVELYLSNEKRSNIIPLNLILRLNTLLDISKQQECSFRNSDSFCTTDTIKKIRYRDCIIKRKHNKNLEDSAKLFLKIFPKIIDYIDIIHVVDTNRVNDKKKNYKKKEKLCSDRRFRHNGPIIFFTFVMMLICVSIQLSYYNIELIYHLRQNLSQIFMVERVGGLGNIDPMRVYFQEITTIGQFYTWVSMTSWAVFGNLEDPGLSQTMFSYLTIWSGP